MRRLAMRMAANAIGVFTLALSAPTLAEAQPRLQSACDPAERPLRQRTALKAMLEDLSSRRGFKLAYWAQDNPFVVHWGGSDPELIASLSGQANLIVRYSPVGLHCPGRWRIETVWVLPAGLPPSIAVTKVAPAASSEFDAGTLKYLHAHGGPRTVAKPASSPGQ